MHISQSEHMSSVRVSTLTKEQSKVYQINYTTLNNLLAPIVVVGLIHYQ